MKKLIMIAAAVAILGGGGAAAYLLTREDSNNDTTQSETNREENNNNTNNNDDAPKFAPTATTNQGFVATIEGTSEGQTALKGTIESDGKGNSYFKGEQGGQTAEYYLLSDGSYIFCQDGACFKSAASGDGPISSDDYTFSDEDITDFQNRATYLGTESCPSGTCNVWQVDDEGVMTKIYVDTDTNIVSQVTGEEDGDTFKVVYEFKDVTINVPTDVQDISNLGQ